MKAEGRIDSVAQSICRGLVMAEDKASSLILLKKHLVAHPEAKAQIWSSFGVPAVLLQEIAKSYVYFQHSTISSLPHSLFLTLEIMIEMCPLPEFREMCVSAQLPLFLYPILNLSSRADNIETIKTLSLTFISILLDEKEDNCKPIEFFKNTELVPLCLRNMELGSEKTKLAASQVFYSIISTRKGLEYTCQTYDRFMATSMILNSVLTQMETLQSPELLEIVIKTYTKLCGMPNAKIVFSKNRPQMLYAEHIREMVRSNPAVKAAYEDFLYTLQN
ncbi:CCR4-NOT transcription complex subunit 9 [Nematocida homosporus]|uniref:CCR4-NOT transcription complex subunit 9 n=1 Tax=Nematocida homosporus TaxID=1912981 RepID=UPI00221EA193|nr:CCR4-NOT transcription complex subunit 9 [Nematocida homosporus]KAI5184740.1 CCR4-NOT transcription complex subunit 9 [Nematocida homosporus]